MSLRSSAVDESWMYRALEMARDALSRDEVPVGAIVIHEGKEIAASSNRTISNQDPTAHAEILAIQQASRSLDRWRLNGCTLYVTLEPCSMCAGALVLARVDRVVFGAWDEKAGMVGSIGDLLRHPRLNHRPEVQGGVLEAASASLLREFFAARRATDFVDSPHADG